MHAARRLEDAQKYVSHKIEPVNLKEVSRSRDMVHNNNEVRIYKPAISQPQPREFRRMDREPNPVRNENDRVNTIREQQNQNIDRLPRMQLPQQGGRNETGNSGSGAHGRRH